jgi:hypothetical protein
VLHAQAHEALEAVVALERIVGTNQRSAPAVRTIARVTRATRRSGNAAQPAVVTRRTGTHG